jgi:hypothetical protein
VLIDRSDPQAPITFFGRMAAGRMARGVIEAGDGYRVGRFVDGEPADTDDRQRIVEDFRIAADGAAAASRHFRDAGNPASAEYYRRASARLAAQMD